MANNVRKYNFSGDVPSKETMENSWNNLKLEKINNWTESTNILKNEIKKLYLNGGIEINRYKIIENNPINYFIFKDRCFVENIYKNDAILTGMAYLKFTDKSPKIIEKEFYTDIYLLAGYLAQIMGYGGAYTKGIPQKDSWRIATEFVENEFGNRFEEINFYSVGIINADWFYDVAWDYSYILADTTNNEIMFMDITDTD